MFYCFLRYVFAVAYSDIRIVSRVLPRRLQRKVNDQLVQAADLVVATPGLLLKHMAKGTPYTLVKTDQLSGQFWAQDQVLVRFLGSD